MQLFEPFTVDLNQLSMALCQGTLLMDSQLPAFGVPMDAILQQKASRAVPFDTLLKNHDVSLFGVPSESPVMSPDSSFSSMSDWSGAMALFSPLPNIVMPMHRGSTGSLKRSTREEDTPEDAERKRFKCREQSMRARQKKKREFEGKLDELRRIVLENEALRQKAEILFACQV